MNESYLAGRGLLAFMVLYHGLAGVLLIVSGDLSIQFAAAVMGWTIEGSPALGIAGEILGCYLIGFALMLVLAMRDPVRHRGVLLVAVGFIALRVIQRVVFADKVMTVFSVPETRYWISCAFVALLGVGLFLFWRQLGGRAA